MAPAKLRGTLNVIFQLMVTIGEWTIIIQTGISAQPEQCGNQHIHEKTLRLS